jgi:hypothetical protein
MRLILWWLTLVFILLEALAPAWASPPPNDNFTNRIALVGNSNSFNGSLAGATLETAEAYPLNGTAFPKQSVWWSWTTAQVLPVTLQVLEISKASYNQDVVTI